MATSKYNKRRWAIPSKRAKGYAEERKSKVHKHGPKEGKELTDYEAGLRSGYLQCQTDHAGIYKYKKAIEAGITTVVFDRNGYLYHGRVKEVADAARNGGLKF